MILAVALPVLAAVVLVHRLALALDHVLFPSLRKVRVTRPLFVVGLPRSGTTLTHRLLASHQGCFTTMPLWELVLAPALCEKYLLRGLKRFDALLGQPLLRMVTWAQARLAARIGDIHPTGLTDPEEDYLGLLPYDGCFLRVLLFPYARSTWALGDFSSLPVARRQRLVAAYRGIVQRHLAFRGQNLRLLSKNPSFTTWVAALKHEFPDAGFVGLHRDLEQVVPSQLSSIRDGLALFGNSVQDPWLVQRFVGLLKHYRRTLEADAANLSDCMQLLDYRMITQEPKTALDQIYDFFDLPSRDSADQARLNRLLNASRTYASRHSYTLEDFGLARADLRDESAEALAAPEHRGTQPETPAATAGRGAVAALDAVPPPEGPAK